MSYKCRDIHRKQPSRAQNVVGQDRRYYAIGLLSGAALGYEILLMRLFSIIHWHHFAYMTISLALLGFGASGSFVALLRERLSARLGPVLVSSAALFGVAA